MKLQLTKAIIYFAAIVLLCIGFSACDKEEENIVESENSNLNTYFSTVSNQDVFRTDIIKYINEKENSGEYVNNLIDTYGIPVWSKALVIDAYYILPLRDKTQKRVDVLWLFHQTDNVLKGRIILNDDCQKSINSFSWMFPYFEQEIFGPKESLYFKENTNKTKSITTYKCVNSYINGLYHGTHCFETKSPQFQAVFIDESSEGGGEGYDFNFDDGDGNPVNNSGGGGTGNPITNPNPIPEILPTPEFTNSKAGCIYDNLKNLSGGFAAQIQKFDGEFPVSHLKFDVNNNLELNNYGRTLPPVNYVTVIELNNNALMDISNLGTALVIAHEVIHAEIFRKMLSVAKKGDLNYRNWPQRDWETYFKSIQNDFSGIYDYYMRYEWNTPNGNPISDAQHEMMASHYIKTLADIIQVFDNNGLSRQEYEDICWLGLRATEVSYNKLSDTEKERIKNNIIKYIKNGIKECN